MKQIGTIDAQAIHDKNLVPTYWMNDDKAQTHYFRSYIKDVYPGFIESFPVLACRASMMIYLPHKYYTIHTRDNTPATGRWVKGRAVEGV